MTDQFSRDRSEKLVKFYDAYRTALDATPVGGTFIKYRWWTLPNPINGAWMTYSQMLDEYASQWKAYRAFKLKLEPLAGKKFKESSDDFRNTYNHGFSSRFVVGITSTVRREIFEGRVRYAFGGTNPLTVTEVADLLEIERNHCYRAFDAFRTLIEEQIAAIAAVDQGGKATSGGRAPDPAVSGDFFSFSPDTGDIVFRGKKVGSSSHANGTTNVALSIAYESQDENWIVPLSWLGYGLRQAGFDQRPPTVLELSFDVEDVEPLASAGPILLVEKTLKVGGRSWRFHKSDADHWPSPLHGHDYDHGEVIDGITGAIYDKATKTHVGQLKPKKLGVMHAALRESKDLSSLAATYLPALPSYPPSVP